MCLRDLFGARSGWLCRCMLCVRCCVCVVFVGLFLWCWWRCIYFVFVGKGRCRKPV
jgi:hypothetical protein